MRILVTGGAGCLGSNLIDFFQSVDSNPEICVVDNFATGSREYIDSLEGIEFFEGSISDYELVKHIFKCFEPNIVIHSAASYKDPNDYEEDCATNLIGTCNLINLSKDYNVDKFIYFQTALCYGRPNNIPIPHTHSLLPFTSYGISKTAGELYLINSGLNFVSLRLANICGPRLSIGPIPTFYKRLKNSQNVFCTEAIRDYLDFDDFLELVKMILEDLSITGIFNVSTGNGYSVYDIYKLVCKYLGIKEEKIEILPVSDDDIKEVVMDPAETLKLGWMPKNKSLEEIIFKQLKYYDEYGVDNIFSHLKKEGSK
jgi:nucleoside-diphosphate-sugar epimerase